VGERGEGCARGGDRAQPGALHAGKQLAGGHGEW
jgi:hypothetical protein